MPFETIRDPRFFRDKEFVETIDVDVNDIVFTQNEGCKSGCIDIDFNTTFIPYQSEYEINKVNSYGIFQSDVRFTPFDKNLNWADARFFPNYRGEYNYCCGSESWVECFPNPKGVIANSGFDIYGNQFFLYKCYEECDTLFIKSKKSGELWVKDSLGNSKKYDEQLDKLQESLDCINTTFEFQNVTYLEVYKDILILTTESKILLAQISIGENGAICFDPKCLCVLEYAECSFNGLVPTKRGVVFSIIESDVVTLYKYENCTTTKIFTGILTSDTFIENGKLVKENDLGLYYNFFLDDNNNLGFFEMTPNAIGGYDEKVYNITNLGSTNIKLLDVLNTNVREFLFVFETQTCPNKILLSKFTLNNQIPQVEEIVCY